jgi:hypothetical protein
VKEPHSLEEVEESEQNDSQAFIEWWNRTVRGPTNEGGT